MDNTVKTYLVPSSLARRAGLAAIWRGPLEVAVFPTLPVRHDTPDTVSEYAPDDAAVFNVRPSTMLHHSAMRQFVNESNGIFLALQGVVARATKENKPCHTELVQFSRQYRSVLRVCIDQLRGDVMNSRTGVDRRTHEIFMTVLYGVECIWHLAEFLFIDSVLGNVVLPHLLAWVRFIIPKHEQVATELLMGSVAGVAAHPEYWNTIVGCLIQGRMEIVCTLLRHHPDAESDPFRATLNTLKSMPMFSISEGISTMEYQARRRQWLIDTQAQLEAHRYVTVADEDDDTNRLVKLIRLIVGEETAWLDAAQNHCETWYELMAGWMLYTEPTVKRYELGDYAKRCISRMGVQNEMRHLDRILLAAFEGEFEFVEEIQKLSENGWCVTHLTDLLHHCGQLQKWQPNPTLATKLRTSYLVDYGTLMLTHHSLWQVGLSYLDHCQTTGTATIMAVLPRLSLTSEVRVHKILREANKRKLQNAARTICKVQAVKYLRNDRLGAALNWAINAGDKDMIRHVADRFLHDYMETSRFRDTVFLENLGPSLFATDRLVFLGRYVEFHRLHKCGNFEEAVEKLLAIIIESNVTPPYFWSTIFMDILPLLDLAIISSNDIYGLLDVLREKKSMMKSVPDKVFMIRETLNKTLARVLVREEEDNCRF